MESSQFSVEIRDLNVSFGGIEVLKNLNLSIKQGEFLVLLGSSGCGKSTLLNCIAGLTDANEGQIFIHGRNVTWEEPSQRGIGMVFQSYALYPQMTVEGNLSFGIKNQKLPKIEVKRRVEWVARLLQLETLLKRKPASLSGGQKQRVAIGRALVRDVDIFLFDEPLSSLDAKLRTDLRVELKRLHQSLGNTMVYVTHDQVEAMTLADRIAVVKDGAVLQLGPPNEIYTTPATKYVADFIGSPAMNFIQGEVIANAFRYKDMIVPVPEYCFKQPFEGDAILGIRPEHIRMGDAAVNCDYQTNRSVELIEPMGADTLIWVNVAEQAFGLRADGQTNLRVGDLITLGFDACHISLFDVHTEQRL